MFPINFNCIVNNLKKPLTKNNFSNQLCPDQFVAKIYYNPINEKWDWCCNYIYKNQVGRSNIDYTNIASENYILIILESPHYDEYYTNQQAKGPAIGTTGKLFEKYFLSIINIKKNAINLNKNLTYNIIFLNSVQYQTSKGIKPIIHSIRDKNWLYFWDKGFNWDLCKRICSYGCNTVVINMCTYGKQLLHDKVQKVLSCSYIKHKMNINNLYQSYHPSTWWIKKRRKIW